ncbi:MAG: ATP-dependent DNA ligase [Alkalilacustris sp.]
MKRFAALFGALDATTRTLPKVAALAEYFRTAPEEDRLWTIALLSGRRPRRAVSATLLRQWAAEEAGIPAWLFEEAYPVVGDLAETIALVLPPPRRRDTRSLSGWMDHLAGLASQDEAARRAGVVAAWDGLDATGRFVFNKLLTGGFRMGVSQGLMTRALAQATGRPEAELAHRLMGNWTPASTSFRALVLDDDPGADLSRPYPFALAPQLEGPPEALGPPEAWLAEWKWDGIRAQLIRRGDGWHLWSRGEELITDRFPDLAAAAMALPAGTVLDGELVAWGGEAPLPFAALQRRLGRKSVPRSLLAEAPAALLAYDVLEWDGADLRAAPLLARRARLAGLAGGPVIRASPALEFADWSELARLRADARAHLAEGLMLKHREAAYQAGRRKGAWWKWKLDPRTVDAVMIYAQAGHGRRAALYTDFTFAVWHDGALVPFTKAYSGLTDAEFRQITAWVRKNTLERFGPVRRVTPELVFEIAFEGIQESPRHKSGLALRFPRMARWRHDKPAAEADTLDSLRALLPPRP